RLQPAVFLDRDGVINEDRDDYVKSWAEYVFYPGALEALRRLRAAGCEVYLVTNQAGVGKGIMPRRALLDILLRLRATVRRHGGMIHGIAFCPHTRQAGCACRKPRPGMLRTLAFKYGLDPTRSVIVGDSCGDIAAGQAVGCRTILLHTRTAAGVTRHLDTCAHPPDHQCASLLQAVELILQMPPFRAVRLPQGAARQ
ncbi:MAG: HAD family hydrolase, partial [Armatimonadetes bacterium]|nr:HAD family hydrolase [Armatimonadota bacterium]